MNKKTRYIAAAILAIASVLLLEYTEYMVCTEYNTVWLSVYMGVLAIWIVLVVLMVYIDRYDYLNYLSISVLAIGIVLAIILMPHILALLPPPHIAHVDKHDYLSMSLFTAGFISMVLAIITLRSEKRPKK